MVSQEFPQSFQGNYFQGGKQLGKVSTQGNPNTLENARVSEESFPNHPQEISTPEMGNSPTVSQSVSRAVSKCPSCGAVVNIRWKRCLACKKPLLDVPGNPAHVQDIEPPKAKHASHSETAVKRARAHGSVNVQHASHSAWTGETAEHAKWFLPSEAPTEPFQLKPGVTVARPALYWQRLRNDVLAGPSGPRAFYGAIQDDLACLYQLFGDTDAPKQGPQLVELQSDEDDVEREAIQYFDGGEGGNTDE